MTDRMKTYGRDFASVYNEKWAFWGSRMWPFLREKVEERNPSAKTWLDLCCGTGSLLKFVSEQGFACMGVDASPHQIKFARRNAPTPTFLVQDIRRLSLPRSFDVITCMFDSLNYLVRRADLQLVFRRVRQHLQPGGLFIFDMNTYEGLEDTWCRTSAMHDRKYTVITESSFDKTKAIGRCLITGFVREGRLFRRFQEEHLERGYRHVEIEACLRSAGFRFTKYDGNRLKPPETRPGRLLYVCQKKKA